MFDWLKKIYRKIQGNEDVPVGSYVKFRLENNGYVVGVVTHKDNDLLYISYTDTNMDKKEVVKSQRDQSLTILTNPR